MIINDTFRVTTISFMAEVNDDVPSALTTEKLQESEYYDHLRQRNTVFLNSHSVSLKVPSNDITCNVNVKLFKNNVAHVSGCKNLKSIEKTVELLNAKNVVVNMINASYKSRHNAIDLESLMTDIKKNDRFASTSYQPARYHGLRATHISGCKFLVFKSGYICIISKNTNDMVTAYHDFDALRTLEKHNAE
jgi:hypothetical protein